MIKIIRIITIFSVVLLFACNEDINNKELNEGQQFVEDEYSEEEYVPQPYDEYCIIISENGVYDGECSVKADTAYYGDNMFVRTIAISDNEALMNVKLDYISITTFAGDQKPKFEVKSYKVTGGHFATKTKKLPEAILPMDINIMVPASDASIFSGDDKPLYQLNSATLSINKIEDRIFDDDEIMVNKMLGGVNGKQFIQGTMSVNISPLGAGAKNMSPFKVTFRTDALWRFKLLKDRTF